jgi:hypothetical protein
MKLPPFSPDRFVARGPVYAFLALTGMQLAQWWGDEFEVLSFPSFMGLSAFAAAFMFAWWRTTPAIWVGALIWSVVVVGTFCVLLVGGILSDRRESWLFWCLALPTASWFTYEQLRFLAVVARENRTLPDSRYRQHV